MGWISVKEGLPEEGQNVIAAAHYPSGDWDIFQSEYEEGKWLDATNVDWDGRPSENKLVTHWMPLPDPPEE